VTADSSSEEEKVLQVLISTESDDEITGVAAALARLSLRKAVQLWKPQGIPTELVAAEPEVAKGGKFSTFYTSCNVAWLQKKNYLSLYRSYIVGACYQTSSIINLEFNSKQIVGLIWYG
jgi:hypothetical protein